MAMKKYGRLEKLKKEQREDGKEEANVLSRRGPENINCFAPADCEVRGCQSGLKGFAIDQAHKV